MRSSIYRVLLTHYGNWLYRKNGRGNIRYNPRTLNPRRFPPGLTHALNPGHARITKIGDTPTPPITQAPIMRFPYGVSDFHKIASERRFYIDRTDRIALIEEGGDQLLLLRPRRFGKSLWLSTLENYYDLARAA